VKRLEAVTDRARELREGARDSGVQFRAALLVSAVKHFIDHGEHPFLFSSAS
jgi:hypothetical protein